jgi:hypothetical protein
MKRLTVREAGRRGGQARARKLSAERMREIAQQARDGRSGKRLGGLSKREFSNRYVQRIRQYDSVLAWFVDQASRAPAHIAAGLVTVLDARALDLLEKAFLEVVVPGLSRRKEFSQ